MASERQTFLEWLDQTVAQPFKEWILANYSNPFLWLGLFLAGLALFGIGYDRLSKNK